MKLEKIEAVRPNIQDLTLDKPKPSFGRKNRDIPFEPLEMIDPLVWGFIGDHVIGSESYSVGVALFMKQTKPESYYERFGGRPSIFDAVMTKWDDIFERFNEIKNNTSTEEIEDVGYTGAME